MSFDQELERYDEEEDYPEEYDEEEYPEEYEMSKGELNQYEKSERIIPLGMRRRKAIIKDYKQLRGYLLSRKKGKGAGVSGVRDLDNEVNSEYAGKIQPGKSAEAQFESDDLSLSSVMAIETKTRKARPL